LFLAFADTTQLLKDNLRRAGLPVSGDHAALVQRWAREVEERTQEHGERARAGRKRRRDKKKTKKQEKKKQRRRVPAQAAKGTGKTGKANRK
jgi:hypothetical protein